MARHDYRHRASAGSGGDRLLPQRLLGLHHLLLQLVDLLHHVGLAARPGGANPLSFTFCHSCPPRGRQLSLVILSYHLSF